jgi:hypothetical protein
MNMPLYWYYAASFPPGKELENAILLLLEGFFVSCYLIPRYTLS